LPDAPVTVRNREYALSPGLRKPELLPPAEIRTAVIKVVDTHHGATREEIPVAVARLFGYKTTSSQLREIIELQCANLLRDGALEEANGMVRLPA
jgi:hypothetical protein